MTVAAVILAATPDTALYEVDGRPAVRRLTDAAWAGGAVPIVVVAPDPDGSVAAALAGSAAILAAPAPAASGPVAQIARGLEIAQREVTDTEAAFIWPARMVWVDPETLTSLAEAHGIDRETVLRPAWDGQAGWPALLPLQHAATLRALGADRFPDALLADLEASGVPFRSIELGDPGAVIDRETRRDQLPPFEGPTEPAGRGPGDWGVALDQIRDDTPLSGPALAPYEQAEANEEGGPEL